ncbi:PLDc N-terminal domain-containing protein [Plantibacter sp. YIM 135347]|uniref:PLDc N-terminal domain-containing protein n=1 Tax=Plantibacter sp. YIM 135347 TaxID=3423919 RepID=UPI003D358F0D
MLAVLSFVLFVGSIAALIDIIRRPNDELRGLPKIMWVLLVVLVPLIGVIVWFTLGRDYSGVNWGSAGRRRSPRQSSQGRYASAAPSGPPVLSTEEQLAALDREIELAEQERRLKRLEAEFDDDRRRDGEA